MTCEKDSTLKCAECGKGIGSYYWILLSCVITHNKMIKCMGCGRKWPAKEIELTEGYCPACKYTYFNLNLKDLGQTKNLNI